MGDFFYLNKTIEVTTQKFPKPFTRLTATQGFLGKLITMGI